MSTSDSTGSPFIERPRSLMPPWLEERHTDRYRKILNHEMTLAEALEENEVDWKRAYEELDAVLAEFLPARSEAA